MNRAIFLCIGALSFSTPWALELKLEQVINYTITQNPDLLRASLDTVMSGADTLTAGLLQNPTLNLNADVFGTQSPYFSPQTKQYGLSLSWPIEWSGRRQSNQELARSNHEYAKKNLYDTTNTVVYQAAQAWVELQRSRLHLENTRFQKVLMDSTIKMNTLLLARGRLSQGDMWRVQSQAQQIQSQVMTAELSYRNQQYALALLLGIADLPEPSLTDTIENNNFNRDSLVQYAIAHRSDLDLLRTAEKQAHAQAKIAELEAYPDLSISADLTESAGSPQYGVSLSIPLMLFNRGQGDQIKAKAQARQAQLATANLLAHLNQDLDLSLLSVKLHQIALDTLYTSLKFAQQSYESRLYAYRSGNSLLLEYLDAVKEWSDLKDQKVDLLCDQRLAILKLKWTAGILNPQRVNP